MIGLETARKLKAAGLHWEPAQGDRFAVPDRGMDDRVFVINDMATIIEMIQGAEMVTFHGTPEWALDYVYLGEAVWLPDEGQFARAAAAELGCRMASRCTTCCVWTGASRAGSVGGAKHWPSLRRTPARLTPRRCCTSLECLSSDAAHLALRFAGSHSDRRRRYAADASLRIQYGPSHAARNSTCWPGSIGQSTGPRLARLDERLRYPKRKRQPAPSRACL